MRNVKDMIQRETMKRMVDSGRRIADIETKEYQLVNATNIGSAIHVAATKATPVAADELGYWDSVTSLLKKLSITELIAWLSTLYVLLGGKAGGQTVNGGTASGESMTLHGSAHATKGPIFINPTSGNAAISTADVEAWHADYRALQLGSHSALMFGAALSGVYVMDNIYYDGAFKRRAAGPVSRMAMYDGTFNLQYAVTGAADSAITFLVGHSINLAGNWGIDTVDVEAWHATYHAMQLSTHAAIMWAKAGNEVFLVSNAYYDGAWKYRTTAPATLYFQSGGAQTWMHAVSGTIDTAITWITDLVIDTSGNLAATGWRKVDVTGIVGSAVTLIANAAGDVVVGLVVYGVASNSTPGAAKVDTALIAPGGTADVVIGADTLRFAVAANGSVTVVRQAGTATWQIAVTLTWM